MTIALIYFNINMLQYEYALIAQSVEHAAVNRSVIGSSPIEGAKNDILHGMSFLIISKLID